MQKRDDPNSRPVYSTDPNAILAPQRREQEDRRAAQNAADSRKNRGKAIKIWLEKKGRGGKAVTVVTDIPGTADFVHDLARELKTACGAGGTVKKSAESFEIEVQGDQRERVEAYLRAKGFAVKRAGS